jgi:hypothetical protein
MNLPSGMTAEDVIALMKISLPDFYRVVCSTSEEEFCDAVVLAVRHCLGLLEDRRKLLAGAGEVQLATELSDLLTRGGLQATAESHVNGHVDLVVRHFEAGRYRMLGECKIDRGPKHHCDGTTQLLGYCGGSERRAMCICFCQKPNVKARLADVREHFEGASTCHFVSETRDNELPWSFVGVHRHASGTSIEILHISCNLHEP